MCSVSVADDMACWLHVRDSKLADGATPNVAEAFANAMARHPSWPGVVRRFTAGVDCSG